MLIPETNQLLLSVPLEVKKTLGQSSDDRTTLSLDLQLTYELYAQRMITGWIKTVSLNIQALHHEPHIKRVVALLSK